VRCRPRIITGIFRQGAGSSDPFSPFGKKTQEQEPAPERRCTSPSTWRESFDSSGVTRWSTRTCTSVRCRLGRRSDSMSERKSEIDLDGRPFDSKNEFAPVPCPWRRKWHPPVWLRVNRGSVNPANRLLRLSPGELPNRVAGRVQTVITRPIAAAFTLSRVAPRIQRVHTWRTDTPGSAERISVAASP